MKKAARIIGLIIVSIIAAIYLSIVVGGFFEDEPLSFDFESLGMVVLSLSTVISVIIAWIKMRIGVWIVLVVGILFAIFGVITAGHNRWMAVVAAGGPLIIGSVLILLGLEKDKQEG